MSTPTRQPAGVPVGGQFAPDARARAEVSLDDEVKEPYEYDSIHDEPHCFVCGRHTDHAGEHDPLVEAGMAEYGKNGSVYRTSSYDDEKAHAISEANYQEYSARLDSHDYPIDSRLCPPGTSFELHDTELSMRYASRLLAGSEFEKARAVMGKAADRTSQYGDDAGADRTLAYGAMHEIDEIHDGPQYRLDSAAGLSQAMQEIIRDKPVRAKITWVHKDSRKPREALDIAVPEGTVLTVRAFSGLPRLNIRSGRAVIQANSVFGNSVTAHPGSRVHVVSDDQDRKITVEITAPAEGREPAVVSTSPGQQDSSTRWHLNPLGMDRSERDAYRLPEVEADRWDEPRQW